MWPPLAMRTVAILLGMDDANDLSLVSGITRYSASMTAHIFNGFLRRCHIWMASFNTFHKFLMEFKFVSFQASPTLSPLLTLLVTTILATLWGFCFYGPIHCLPLALACRRLLGHQEMVPSLCCKQFWQNWQWCITLMAWGLEKISSR